MYRKLGIIGRDRLLQKEIFPRCKGKKAPFILLGKRGLGKSAVLDWAYEYGKEPKALINAEYTVKENLVAIAKGWKLEINDGLKVIPIDRATLADLDQAILKQSQGNIYIDDLQDAKPVLLRKLKIWRERYQIYCTATPPLKRETLKRCVWGLKQIELKPIEKKFRLILTQKACEYYGSSELPSEIAQNCKGNPSRIMAMAQGTIENKAQRVKGEELDISPVLLFVLAAVVGLRYIGHSMDDYSLFIIGGLGVSLMMAFRFFLYKGFKR